MPQSPSTVLDLESRLFLMRALHDNPYLSPREWAGQLGVSLGESLGKTNDCLRALIEKGHVKAGRLMFWNAAILEARARTKPHARGCPRWARLRHSL